MPPAERPVKVWPLPKVAKGWLKIELLTSPEAIRMAAMAVKSPALANPLE